MKRLLLRTFDAFFGDTVRRVEAEASNYRESEAGQRNDSKVIWVLITAAIMLVIQSYAGNPYTVRPVAVQVAKYLSGPDAERVVYSWFLKFTELDELTWFATCAILAYVVFPVLVIKCIFRENLRDYGTKLTGVLSGWWIYLIFVSVMVPLVWIFSAESGFQKTYPFYKVHTREQVGHELLIWELLYALQFVGLEFFFRGFMVHGTKHRFGVYCVFVMMVPYCMIHFQKPLPECVASIIAGIALGLMSLKTRSIWLGAALHISVAWGMDFCSLYRRGLIG